MPSKSKKQHRFMGAVANNPEFAAEVGVPQSVGASFMAKDKKKYMGGGLHRMPKYKTGKMVDAGGAVIESFDRGQGMGFEHMPPESFRGDVYRSPNVASKAGLTGNRPRGEEFDVERVKPRKKKKKKGLHNLYVGGKIRGCGKAVRGRKKAKRIVMKGS